MSRTLFRSVLALALGAACCAPAAARATEAAGLLPPVQHWSGSSEGLVAAADDPWITPSERSGLTTTPRYEETVAWLEKLVAAAPELAMVSIGTSLQGRDIRMVIASRERAFTPDAMRASGKPLLLAQAGIHAGEIDGKDAGLMLLRDLTVAGKRSELLRRASFLFIPILNVDGHERFSRFNRINQRGPQEMGWRTNARNQNLNRDYAKLDTRGIRAVVRVLEAWRPDLYLDLHVTDGADYQYDITFGGNGDARHLPTVLVENHSLKPYRQRVLGTYVLLAASLELLGAGHSELQQATRRDRARRPDPVPLAFRSPDGPPAEKVPFRGIASERYQGPVSGGPVVRWTGQPWTRELPVARDSEPRLSVSRPAAYIIPPQWADIAERVALHGVRVERLEGELAAEAEFYRLPQARIAQAGPWAPNPFEGHVRIDPGTPEVRTVATTFPPGSYRVDTDQPLGDLAVLMLEPASPDSFLQWGFLLEIFTRTEYAEAYVMEPLAQKMMQDDPALRAAFEAKLAAEPEFAASPRQRLLWFYRRTPYHDRQYRLYPIARIPR